MATGSGFGKLNFTGLFLGVIQLELVIIERLSVLNVAKSLGLLAINKNGRVAEWFKALSWKGSEGNTSASSNLVSSSIWGCRIAAIAMVSKTIDESPPRFES